MVSLRRFNKNDTVSYLEIANDKSSYFPFGSCNNLQEAEYVINIYMYYEEIDAYAIIDNDILIGVVYIENCKNIEKNTVLISYFIGNKFQRRGYAIQALERIEQLLIENSQIQKVGFEINPKNIPSIKTATRFGAKFCKSGEQLDYYEKVII